MDDEPKALDQLAREAEQFTFDFAPVPKPQPHPADYVKQPLVCINNCKACRNCDGD